MSVNLASTSVIRETSWDHFLELCKGVTVVKGTRPTFRILNEVDLEMITFVTYLHSDLCTRCGDIAGSQANPKNRNAAAVIIRRAVSGLSEDKRLPLLQCLNGDLPNASGIWLDAIRFNTEAYCAEMDKLPRKF